MSALTLPETNSAPSVSRPFAVRARAKSWRTGEWGRWRTYATYSSIDKAIARAAIFNADPRYEAYVRQAGLHAHSAETDDGTLTKAAR